MTDTEDFKRALTESLRKANEVARDAFSTSDTADVTEVQDAKAEVGRIAGSHYRDQALVDAQRGRRTRIRVDQDELGVSVLLTGGAVILSYPAECRRFVSLPMAWLVDRQEATDRLIQDHCDADWLSEVVNFNG